MSIRPNGALVIYASLKFLKIAKRFGPFPPVLQSLVNPPYLYSGPHRKGSSSHGLIATCSIIQYASTQGPNSATVTGMNRFSHQRTLYQIGSTCKMTLIKTAIRAPSEKLVYAKWTCPVFLCRWVHFKAATSVRMVSKSCIQKHILRIDLRFHSSSGCHIPIKFCVSPHKKADWKRILCGKLTYELCKTPPSLCLNAFIWNRRFSCFSQCIIAVWGQFVSNRCRSSCCGNRHDDHDGAEPWLIMDFRYVDGIMLPERHTHTYLHSGLQACALHLHRSSGTNHSK